MGINTFDPRFAASANQANQLAADARSLDKLKREAHQSPEQAARAVAQQFESVLAGMVLNSMRNTLPQDGMLSSGQNQLWTSMYDQQLSQQLGAKGLGLTEMLTQQIKRQMSGANPENVTDTAAATGIGLPAVSNSTNNSSAGAVLENMKAAQVANVVNDAGDSDANNVLQIPASAAFTALSQMAQAKANRAYVVNSNFAATRSATNVSPAISSLNATNPTSESNTNNLVSSLNSALQSVGSRVENALVSAGQRFSHTKSAFVSRLKDAAERVGQSSGIPAQFILGQAALESGWGRKEIKGPNGEHSFNLFGIKANKSWTGPTVETVTTEFVNGQYVKVKQQFRAYGSYEEAMQDYSQFITKNPRYAQVVANATDLHSFATNLQKAGYATDPAYASKLMKVVRSLA